MKNTISIEGTHEEFSINGKESAEKYQLNLHEKKKINWLAEVGFQLKLIIVILLSGFLKRT